MVVYPNAIVQPGAVMVKAFDAAVADGAVAAAWRAKNETVGAHFARVDLLEELEEVVPLV